MIPVGRWVRTNGASLLFATAAVALFALLIAADARLGLSRHVSNRYRFHAIPVAVSRLAHGCPHDYTAVRSLAHRFHDGSGDLDEQIAESLANDPGTGTYFWVADDRGLGDYTAAAFRLFGFRGRSLTDFWFLLLGTSAALFVVGFWGRPGALVLPVLVLFGLLVLAQALPFRDRVPFDLRGWREGVGLSESRLFDALSLLAVLHLALAAVGAAGRSAWVAAVPQAALLLFLYHCRSSLGWQYLALFALAAGRGGWCLWVRRPRDLAAPLCAAALLAISLVGLNLYKHAAYHPAYFAERGSRTFWHNALMGLSFHHRLRAELPMPRCEDRDAVELVLARMRALDPNLDPGAWNATTALNSLGSHNAFDWPAYEAAARELYFDLWRTRPRDMVSCHAVYKPRAVLRQSVMLTRLTAEEALCGRAWELSLGFAAVVAACGGLWLIGRRGAAAPPDARRSLLVVAWLLPFGLIPAVAFYPAITTTGGFFVAAWAAAGLLAVRLAWAVFPSRFPEVSRAD